MKKISAFTLLTAMGFMALGTPMSRAQTLTNGDWIYTLNASNEATITGYAGSGGDISIPDNLNNLIVRQIGNGAFANAAGIVRVVVPLTITNIGAGAYKWCGDLESVVLPDGLQNIPEDLFFGCPKLSVISFSPTAAVPGNLVIPGTITNIGRGAFYGNSIRSAIISANVDSVAAEAFARCTSLDGVLFLGDAPANVSNDIFTGSPNVIVYFLQGTTGWDSTFSGRETAPFNANLALGYGLMEITKSPNNFSLYNNSQYDQNRTKGQLDVTTNPSAFNLYTKSQFDGNRAAGQQDVISNPMSYGLYTTDSIMDLRMGGLMIQKQGTGATIVFQPQTTTDLATEPFTNHGTPITNTIPMPGSKGFLRIQAR